MLLSVLLISSAVLGAATIAGLLVVFQLRQTADAESSAQAVFAADSGIERALYTKYQLGGCVDGTIIESNDVGVNDVFTVPNRTIDYKVVFGGGGCISATSAGRSGRSARAFSLRFDGIENYGGQFIGP